MRSSEQAAVGSHEGLEGKKKGEHRDSSIIANGPRGFARIRLEVHGESAQGRAGTPKVAAGCQAAGWWLRMAVYVYAQETRREADPKGCRVSSHPACSTA